MTAPWMNAVLIAKGFRIRIAQKLTGKKLIDGADMRRGLELLNITEARWKQLRLPDFAQPIDLSCSRPQRPRQRLSRAVGRPEVDERVGFNRTDLQQGSAADRQRGRAVRESQRRLAEAQPSLAINRRKVTLSRLRKKSANCRPRLAGEGPGVTGTLMRFAPWASNRPLSYLVVREELRSH